ncbi:DDE-type integrase/transposase/recombinase [Hymenobacter sp. BRD67]|nr:DDE-type integrase/transposase/recombinase [Hymenobacter sp. BRD67]
MGDITYLALATGQWAYLACWRDAFSRRVVGWHVSESLHTDLILTAFNRAVAVCQPPPGLLVHADRAASTLATLLPPYLTGPRPLPA